MPKKHVLINKNPATSAISIKRKQVSKKEANEIAASYKRWTQSSATEGKDAGEVTIWHRADGTAYNRRSYKDDFNSLKKLYGLPDDFHWHDFRHVYATLMVQYQVNIKELAVVLGHSSGI